MYKFVGASGGPPVSNVKMSDVVETIYVSERREENLLKRSMIRIKYHCFFDSVVF